MCGVCCQPDERLSISSAQPGHSKLSIYDTQRSHSGRYTCLARNRAGVANKTSLLTVECK